MASIVAGLAGGLVATTVMTTLTMLMGDDSPPPTDGLVSKFARGQPEDHRMPGILLDL